MNDNKDINGILASQTKDQSKAYRERVNYYLQLLTNQPVLTAQNIHIWHDNILNISQSINELATGKQITDDLEQLCKNNEYLRIQFDYILENQFPHLKTVIREKLEKSQDPNNQDISVTSCRVFNYGSQVFDRNNKQVEFMNYTLDSFIDSDVRDRIKKTIVSFLNSIGGTIFIGIRDYDKTVAGVDLSNIDMDSLKLIILDIRQQIQPDCNLLINVDFIPVMQFGKFSNGKWVARVKVGQGDLNTIYAYQINLEDSSVFSSAFRQDGLTQSYGLKEFLVENKQIYQIGRQQAAGIEYAKPHDQAYKCESDDVSYPPQLKVEKPIKSQEQFEQKLLEYQIRMKQLEDHNKRLDSELIIAKKYIVGKDQILTKERNDNELLLEIKELKGQLKTKKEKNKQKKNQIKILEEKCRDLTSKQFEIKENNQQQFLNENQQGNGNKNGYQQAPWNSYYHEQQQNYQDNNQVGLEKQIQKTDPISEIVNQFKGKDNFRDNGFGVQQNHQNQYRQQNNHHVKQSEDNWKSKQQQQEQKYPVQQSYGQIKQDKQLNKQKYPKFKEQIQYERKDKGNNNQQSNNFNNNNNSIRQQVNNNNNVDSYDPQYEEEEEKEEIKQEQQYFQSQDMSKPTYYAGGTPQYDMSAELSEEQFSMPNRDEGISQDLLHNYGLWILFAMRSQQDCERILKIFQEELLSEDCQIKLDESRNIVGGFFLNSLLARKFYTRISKKNFHFLKVLTKLTKSQEIKESYFLYGQDQQKKNDQEKNTCPIVLLDNINGKEEVEEKLKMIMECQEIKYIQPNWYLMRMEEDKIMNITAQSIAGVKKDKSVERIGAIVGDQVTVVGNNLNPKEIENYLNACIIFIRFQVVKQLDNVVVKFSNSIDAIIGQIKLEESGIKGIHSVSIDQIVDVPFGF